jgi:hypothetical protein
VHRKPDREQASPLCVAVAVDPAVFSHCLYGHGWVTFSRERFPAETGDPPQGARQCGTGATRGQHASWAGVPSPLRSVHGRLSAPTETWACSTSRRPPNDSHVSDPPAAAAAPRHPQPRRWSHPPRPLRADSWLLTACPSRPCSCSQRPGCQAQSVTPVGCQSPPRRSVAQPMWAVAPPPLAAVGMTGTPDGGSRRHVSSELPRASRG